MQPRDRKLLSALQIIGLIDREQAEILGPFASICRANARLLQLTRAGYLKRSWLGTISGGRKCVYRLPGRRLARQDAAEHQLAVSDLYCLFTRSGALLEWRRIDAPLSPEVPIIPDGLAMILDQGEAVPCLVEVDRGTETLSVIEKKVECYLSLALSGQSSILFGCPRFRVLIVTSSARRLENIRKVIQSRTNRIFFLAVHKEIKQRGPLARVFHRPAGERVFLICDTVEPAAD